MHGLMRGKRAKPSNLLYFFGRMPSWSIEQSNWHQREREEMVNQNIVKNIIQEYLTYRILQTVSVNFTLVKFPAEKACNKDLTAV